MKVERANGGWDAHDLAYFWLVKFGWRITRKFQKIRIWKNKKIENQLSKINWNLLGLLSFVFVLA